jgi:hypothetical protein
VTARSGSFVLLVDHDLGFLMWLGEVFNELGWQAFPALQCRQALALAKRSDFPLTALVINPGLPGAARAVKGLAAAYPGLRVVLIVDSAAELAAANRLRSWSKQAGSKLERPQPWEPISRPDWVAKVQRALAESGGM